MNDPGLHEAYHLASRMATASARVVAWLGELEKQKRDAGHDYIAGCIRADILAVQHAAQDIRDARANAK